MRWTRAIFVEAILAAAILAASSLALAVPAHDPSANDPPSPAADDPTSVQPIACTNGVPGGVSCILSKQDRRTAHNAYARGLKFESRRRLEEAYKEFDRAARLVPEDPKFLTAREVVKSQLVHDHIAGGNAFLSNHSNIAAAAEFRAALDLDPDNIFAREQFAEATRGLSPPQPSPILAALEDAGEIQLQPKPDLATFHFQGDVHGLYGVLAAAYGISAQFDDSVQNHPVVFNVDNADFFTALRLAAEVSKTMWTALSAHQVLIAADTQENHRNFDRMSLGTFAIPPHSTPQEATEYMNILRTMFDLRFITIGQASNVLEVRAPAPTLRACAQLLSQLDHQKPQVMIDVSVFEIDHSLAKNIGLHIPDTFNLYNIPAAALLALGGQSLTSLINQLVSSGGINQAGSSSLSALLAQLEGQNSIFSQPLATFGGGLTLMGLSLDQLSAALSTNESWSRALSSLSLRADQGTEATFHVGERYPILNSSYAPIYNSPQIAQVIGNQSYLAPFPSVSYEDLGLNLKTKPYIHGTRSIGLDLELQVRSLTGQSSNGVPVISNREFKGGVNLADGESAVIAGEVSRSDTVSMSGIPGLGLIPLLNKAMVTNTKQEDDDELMIVITPHIVSNIDRTTAPIWITQR
jgi:general secretion pathway protein D